MISLKLDLSAISKLVRHFSVSPKLRNLQNVLSKCQTPSNRMISLKSDFSAISKLVRHFSVSSKLRKLHNIWSKCQILSNRMICKEVSFSRDNFSGTGCIFDTIQDFLCKLGMKPHMHLVEISIFSLNNVTVRLTKIMNNLLEHLKILIFKVIFQC